MSGKRTLPLQKLKTDNIEIMIITNKVKNRFL